MQRRAAPPGLGGGHEAIEEHIVLVEAGPCGLTKNRDESWVVLLVFFQIAKEKFSVLIIGLGGIGRA